MRLENYYTLTTKRDGTTVDDYNTLTEALNNIPDLDNKEELSEYDYIEIAHSVEYYDGTYETTTLYLWENSKVKVLDDEITTMLAENSLWQTKDVKFDYDEEEDGQTVEYVVIDGKKYIDLEYHRNKVDELQGQFDYECGCNKELVATQDKNERLKILLANALTILEENGFGGQSFCQDELGMTEEEYKDIMGEE